MIKLLLVSALALGLSACAKSDSTPITPTQAIIQEMSMVESNCVNQGEENHTLGSPAGLIPARKFLCQADLTHGGCNVWISTVSFSRTYLPTSFDIDNQCAPSYRF